MRRREKVDEKEGEKPLAGGGRLGNSAGRRTGDGGDEEEGVGIGMEGELEMAGEMKEQRGELGAGMVDYLFFFF